MKKYILPILILLFISTTLSAQDTKQRIDQLKTDPQTAERAAKADDRLIDRKLVTDTSSTTIKTKRKERGCKSTRRKKYVGI